MGDVEGPVPSVSPWYYLDYLQMGVMVVDEYYRIAYWNRWLENHSNIISDSIILKPFKSVFPELADSRLFELIQQVIEEQLSGMISSTLNKSQLPLYPSINHQLKQMDLMQQMVQVTAMEDANGRKLAMVQVTDMTRQHLKNVQIKSQSDKMQALINLDAVTSLPNRQKFDISLDSEYRRAVRAKNPLVAGVVEIDHFDAFARHYGVSVADEALMKITTIFQSLLCRETDLVTRYASQSYGLILPCTSEEGCVMIAQELLRAVKGLDIPHAFSGASSVMTVSIGLALVEPNKPDEIETFVNAFNFALNHAHDSGGDRAMLYLMEGGRMRDCEGGHGDGLDQEGQLLLQM